MGDLSRFKTIDQALAWVRKEGFTVVWVRCLLCGFGWWAICEPGADVHALHCSECHGEQTEAQRN